MSVQGTWVVEIATPIGKQEVTLMIDERDGAVSGTAKQGEETVPFIDAVLDDNRLRWSQKITKPMSLTLKFDLVFIGDVVSGTAKPGFLPSVQVQGRRA